MFSSAKTLRASRRAPSLKTLTDQPVIRFSNDRDLANLRHLLAHGPPTTKSSFRILEKYRHMTVFDCQYTKRGTVSDEMLSRFQSNHGETKAVLTRFRYKREDGTHIMCALGCRKGTSPHLTIVFVPNRVLVSLVRQRPTDKPPLVHLIGSVGPAVLFGTEEPDANSDPVVLIPHIAKHVSMTNGPSAQTVYRRITFCGYDSSFQDLTGEPVYYMSEVRLPSPWLATRGFKVSPTGKRVPCTRISSDDAHRMSLINLLKL